MAASSRNSYWNKALRRWESITPSGGSGGGGGASTIVDGGDVAQGSKADAAATNSTGSWSIVSILKGLYERLTTLNTSQGSTTTAVNTVNTTAGGTTTAITTQTTTLGGYLVSIRDSLAGVLRASTLFIPGQRTVFNAVAAGGAANGGFVPGGVIMCSIVARGTDLRFTVASSNASPASATSNLLMQNERLDIRLPATAYISVISDNAVPGSIEITGLL